MNTCKQCQARMTAYIDGELSGHVRRRMARHIHNCPECYAEYQRKRDLRQLLDADLPRFGVPARTQLSAIWAGVQSGIRQPKSYARASLQPFMRYSVIVMLFFVVLFLPMALNGQPVTATVPSPALPAITATVEVSAELLRTQGSAPKGSAPVGTAVASNFESLDAQTSVASDTPAAQVTPNVQPPLIPVPSVTASR